jgi:hypothetical protein
MVKQIYFPLSHPLSALFYHGGKGRTTQVFRGGETLKCSRKRIMQGAILTNLATAQKNMASAEKVDTRGLILVSKFLLRLLDKLDDEMVQLVTQDQQQRN